MANHHRRYLLGLPVDLLSLPEALAICRTKLAESAGPPLRIITLNPELAILASRHPGLAACFAGNVLVVPDGIGIVLAGRRRGWPGFARVPGIDLLPPLAAVAAALGRSVFLFGGPPDQARRAAQALQRQIPHLRVAGTASGFLEGEAQKVLPERIAASGAGLVLAALGAPNQERWLADTLPGTGARLGMGVGGSFAVLAGEVSRAPRLLRRAGLEWAFRLCRQPARWRRTPALVEFFWRGIIRGGD